MFTMPAAPCHWCHSWKDNAFGICSKCHRFSPPQKSNDIPFNRRAQIRGSIVKHFFEILKFVRFFIHTKFDFSKSDLFEIRDLVNDAYAMMIDPFHKSQVHPDLLLEDFVATILYKLGIQESATLFIDDVTIMYGYGECSSIGDFQFTIPHRFLKPGTTLRSLYVTCCDLKSKQESIIMHSYKEVA